MAAPAGSHPASPPAIPGKAAAAACAAMAVSYVAVLYAPTLLLRLPPATSLRAFFHRRFVCAAVSSAASVLATAALLGVWSLSDSSQALAVFGIRSDHLLEGSSDSTSPYIPSVCWVIRRKTLGHVKLVWHG